MFSLDDGSTSTHLLKLSQKPQTITSGWVLGDSREDPPTEVFYLHSLGCSEHSLPLCFREGQISCLADVVHTEATATNCSDTFTAVFGPL